MIDTLENFALENYEAGGHWVYETHEAIDYQAWLDEANGDVEAAKGLIHQYWDLMNERQADCAW